MRALFSSLTSAHALLFILSLLALGGVLIGVTLVDGWFGQAAVVTISMLVLLLGAKVVTPAEVHRQRSIRYVVFVFAGIVPVLVVARPLIDQFVLQALQTLLPDFSETALAQYPDAPIALALVLVFLMYAVTLLTLRTTPPLGRIARDPHLREASYTERRATFVKVLESHLGRVDEDLRWHQRDFVELRAEVDVRNGNRTRRRVVDLVEAIKQNRDADISWTMFESQSRGLEMSVHELRRLLACDDIDAVVDALVAARLVRKSPRTQAVSFVHRRFNEYFLVSRWLTGERTPPFEAIPTDSRFRDALVLYAEVAPEAEASALALSCWREIEPLDSALLQTEGGTDRVLRAIYALRFLGEAFRTRSGPLAEFRDALGGKVLSLLLRTDDLLYQKIAVEAAGLLLPSDAEAALLVALQEGSPWIKETAFGACRYLGELPDTVEHALTNNLLERSQLFILNPDRDLNYLLTVSDVFRSVQRRFRATRIDTTTSTLAAVALIAWGASTKNSNVAIAVTLLVIASSLSVFWSRQVVRLEPERNAFLSPILTPSEFLLGILGTTPWVVLMLLMSHGFSKLSSLLLSLFNVHAPTVPESQIWTLDVQGFAVAVLLCVSIIPFFRVSQILTRRQRELSQDLSLQDMFLVSFLLRYGRMLSWLIPTVLILQILPKWLITYIGGGLLILFVVFLGILLVRWAPNLARDVFYALRQLRAWFRDHQRLSGATAKFVSRRADIAASFEGFETTWARKQYVDWVEREAAAHDHLAALADIITNPWPGGRRPNRSNDAASTRLAQLDERWLKLDV